MKLLIATHNKAKIEDYKNILNSFNILFTTLEEQGIADDVEEIGKTLEENACLKAEYYSKLCNLPTIADDSGFCIDALGGEPGVYSRRWPGYHATDEELLNMVQTKMQNIPEEKRTAAMTNVIALANASGKIVITSTGQIKGFIPLQISEKRNQGFPYRSVLFVSEFNKFWIDLTLEDYRKLNYRYKAIEKIIPQIKRLLN